MEFLFLKGLSWLFSSSKEQSHDISSTSEKVFFVDIFVCLDNLVTGENIIQKEERRVLENK